MYYKIHQPYNFKILSQEQGPTICQIMAVLVFLQVLQIQMLRVLTFSSFSNFYHLSKIWLTSNLEVDFGTSNLRICQVSMGEFGCCCHNGFFFLDVGLNFWTNEKHDKRNISKSPIGLPIGYLYPNFQLCNLFSSR